MRKFLIPLLMAGVLMPAAALAEPGDRDGRSRGERSERSEKSDDSASDRPQRAERSSRDAPRVERAERPSRDMQRARIDRPERPAGVESNFDAQVVEPVRVRRGERQQAVQPVEQVRQVERRRDRNNDGFVGAIQQAGRDEAARQRGEVVVRRDGNRDGDRRWRGDRDGNHRWSGDWRRDHRYDWQSYRSRYSTLFRLGRYYDPYRYGYRRFSIGFSLWPSYYGSNYWLDDPWQYRLPPAYGPYRWVRYYDDALLVNIYTGQVVDVVYNFFW